MNEIKNALTEYAESFTSEEGGILKELREHCYKYYEDSSMLSGFYQGRVLSMISKMLRPKYALEIGTYLGYSALCIAEGLAEDGKVITLDILEETNKVAKEFVSRTEFKNNIEFRVGDALEIIPGLHQTFDLVFIDADKPNYSNYYDLVIDMIRPGGFIIADNVLWSGKVIETDQDETTKALHDFNKKVLADVRVSNVLLPIRDGLMIITKN